MVSKTTNRQTKKQGDMQITTMYLPKKDLELLKGVAEAHGKKPSNVITELIKNYLNDNKEFYNEWLAKEKMIRQLKNTKLSKKAVEHLLANDITDETLKKNWAKVLNPKKR